MRYIYYYSLAVILLFSNPLNAQTGEVDVFDLSLEELSKVKIISVSNIVEELSDAPATVIVISMEEIEQRGYNDLSEIFDDLPGMEMVRPFGDTYFKNYWRGYRNDIGAPFLVMVDGVSLNTLYFGIITPMASLPLTVVERIEVVYGPASSVYGANAFMGVINIITVNDKKDDGVFINTRLTSSMDRYQIADGNLFYKKGNIRFSASGHLETGDLRERIDNNDFYWLNDEHYADQKLWGDFVNNPLINASKFSSHIRNRGVDLRLYAGDIEIGARYLGLDTGHGLVFPGDKITANSAWPRFMYSAFMKHRNQLSDQISTRTMFRYRSDGITNDAFDLEGYNVTNSSGTKQIIGGTEVEPGESARNLFLNHWQTLNSAWSIFQDFEVSLNEKVSFVSGIKYEYKNLQKSYDINTAPGIFPDLVDASSPIRYPDPPIAAYQYQNRIIWQDKAVYFQGKYVVDESNIINLGMRVDDNSSYGTATTFRTSYIRHFGKFTGKFLYGESFQEPIPRNLYGGWTGSGSDPSLKPEESHTFEANVSYSTARFSNLLSLYFVQNSKTIINFTGGARNSGDRNVLGLDYHIQGIIPASSVKQLKVWAYYSTILKEEEQKFDSVGNKTGMDEIGDLAHQKIYFGANCRFNTNFNANLRGRFIGDRTPIYTNPFNVIDGYFTMDLNLIYKDLFATGFAVGLKVVNLFDKKYYHPGIREADSGDPDTFAADKSAIGWDGKAWNGSKGWYNSKLPQPRRMVMFSLSLNY